MNGNLLARLVGALGLLVWNHTATVAVSQPSVQMAQASVSSNSNRPQLNIGSQGAFVSELQATLKLLGYFTGTVDGVYTQTTAAAVSQFQQAAKLNPDGIVNQQTWERLFPTPPATATATPPSTNVAPSQPKPTASPRTPVRSPANSQPANLPLLKLGMRGASVTQLQRRLQTLGLFKGAADGIFGTNTEAAVKAAQRRYKLNPDGVVGTATWNAILRQPTTKK